jgi:hypothetical protein
VSYDGQDDLVILSLKDKPSPELSLGEQDRDRPREKRRSVISDGMRAVGYLTAVVATLTGFLTCLGFHSIHERLAQWPRIEANVESCENYHVQVQHGGDAPYTSFEYGFRCRVSYTPQSLIHHSLIDIGYKSSDPNEMAAWALRIHSGDQIPVVYDPNDFTRIHFATDFNTSYAPAVHNLRFVAWMTLVSVVLIGFGRVLRPDQSP